MKPNHLLLTLLFALLASSQGFAQSKTVTQYSTVQLDSLKTGSHWGVNLLGENVRIGMWEAKLGGTSALVDTTVSDISHVTNRNAGSISSHATTIAKIIASKGVSTPSEKGVAPNASVYAYDFDDDIHAFATEFGNAVSSLNLLVSNHSYSENNGWSSDSVWQGVIEMSETEDYKFGYYGNTSRIYDSLMAEYPHHLIVRSVGNDRGNTGSTNPFKAWSYQGSYSQVSRSTPYPEEDGGSDGYDGLSRDATSKNALMVGAVDYLASGYSTSTDIVFTNSSSAWGLCDDGRIKPDVVGPGQLLSTGPSYTSYASAIVTGLAALSQELYRNEHGRWLSAASCKGVLIHTADPATSNGGPSAAAGWGLVNANSVAEYILNQDGKNILLEAELANGETDTYRVYLDGSSDFRATLVWTDPKGTSPTLDFDGSDLDDSTPILVNDLDIQLWNTSGPSLEVEAWKMDVNNPGDLATKGDNDVDNVERIDWSSGSISAGWYTIRISHEGTLLNPQKYSLLVSNAGGVSYSSGAWTADPSTWSGGEIVTIDDASNTATISEDVTIGQLIVKPGSKLRIAEGNAVSVLSEALLEASASGFAQVKGPMVGTIVHQNYLAGSADYRYISSPVKCDVQSWLEDMWIASVTGSSSPSVYAWNASTTSWYAPSAIDSVNDIDGLALYLGTNAYGQFSMLPFTKVSKGAMRDRHTVLSLETDSDGIATNSDEGWNLISNPYLAALDWSQLDVSQTGGSWYVWDHAEGAFSSSDGSSHILNGTQYIPPAQSFWVYCPNGSTGALTLDSSAVTLTQNPSTFKKVNELRITWHLANGKREEALISFSDRASTGFVLLEDQPKRMSYTDGRIDAYWKADGVKCCHTEVNTSETDSIQLAWQAYNAQVVHVEIDAELERDLNLSWEYNGVSYPLELLPMNVWNSDTTVYLKWNVSGLAVQETNREGFTIAFNRINWRGEEPVKGVVYDMTGRELLQLKWEGSGEKELRLNSGAYLFTAENGYSTRFVIP